LKKHKLTQGSSNSKHLNDYTSDKYSLIDDIDSVISITKYLIENQDAIFFIDSELHNELIQTIDNVSESDVNSILTRKIHQSIGITLMKNTSTTSSLLNTPILSSDGSDESSSYAKLNFNNVNSTLTKQSSKNTLNSKTKLNTNVDFIDSNREKRTSRTKLHKITSNFNSSSNLLQPIHFVNSPSHSPISSSSNGSSSNQPQSKQLNETGTRKFSNDLYDEPDLNSLHPIFCNQASSSSSSLLLMIPTQANKNNIKKLTKSTKCRNLNPKASAKSLSNLHENNNNSNSNNNIGSQSINQYLTVPIQVPERRQSIQTFTHQQQQYKCINSNTIQICSKFYDKNNSNFNVIGEQETLV
jgi:hypothetical protein